jgi:FAD/FMN-containing dehydrogenase
MIHPDDLLDELAAALGDDAVLRERSDLSAFESGWRYGRGRARAAVRPATPEQVALTLQACDAHGVRVQPMGANTGLVGASRPDGSGEQLVLSLERLDRVLDIDPVDRTVLVEAGVTLSRLNEALAPHGLCLPVDLGADPQIGGMIATNTGGTRLLRHGDVRRHVLGLEVALSDGTLLVDLRRLRKNNTGLDWKQLFCGTSGTFGVVTRAVLAVSPVARQRTAMLAATADGEAVLRLLATLEREAGEVLSAFEALSREALELTLRHGAGLRDPFGGTLPAYAVLIELATTLPPEHLDLEALLAGALEAQMERDPEGLLEVVVGREQDFWAIRHQVSESLRREGAVLALDLSVPRSSLARFTETVRQRLATADPGVRVADFGHWGDGGTHLNLIYDPATLLVDPAVLQQLVYDLCVDGFGGSYSAEHGVGPHNQGHYVRFTSPDVREVCGALKRHFDPDRRLGNVRLD